MNVNRDALVLAAERAAEQGALFKATADAIAERGAPFKAHADAMALRGQRIAALLNTGAFSHAGTATKALASGLAITERTRRTVLGAMGRVTCASD